MADRENQSPTLYNVLKLWCDTHGVKFDPDPSIDLGAEFNYENPKALYIKVRSEADEPMFLHEAFHAYYYVQRMAGLDKKQVEELKLNDIGQTKALTEMQDRLEPGLQAKLEKIFGPPTFYGGDLSPTQFADYVNNLVDESRTTKTAADDRVGHPTQDFNEFCASLCATAAYGKFETFKRQMQQFRQAAQENPDLAPLYNHTCDVLGAAVKNGLGFAEELRKLNGFRPEPPELMRMYLNLLEMNKLMLQLVQAQTEEAGRTGIETARR